LFEKLPPACVGAQLASEAGHVSSVFAAIVMSPVSLALKRGENSRSAYAAGATASTRMLARTSNNALTQRCRQRSWVTSNRHTSPQAGDLGSSSLVERRQRYC